ncbi:MAG TPA: hypothetical protein VK021_13695 [Flavobacteriaceae bacterium]|nr:hypothetical protein [Flavobacteriaceae bacterium]
MKNQLILFSIIFLSLNCYSQISFEEGYYIDNSNQKISCLIKNIDWKNNPTKFEYKLTEDSDIKKATIENVKEFEIFNASKYIRDTVMIDKSLNHPVKKLSKDKEITFQEETLFLKVLVEGKASLYSYENGDLKKFFYNKDNADIEQLIFKRYIARQLKVGTNNAYKQQLFNDLKCSSFNKKKFERLEYRNKNLINLFVEYNECRDQAYINYEERQQRHIFNLNIRPGISSSSLLINGNPFDLKDIDFDNEIAFRFGIEAEYILPVNRNKWAIVVEPTFQSYKSEKTNQQKNISGNLLISRVTYRFIEIPASIRHYLYLNNNSKIFINLSLILDFSFDSSVELTRADGSKYYSLEMESRKTNYALGIGYKLQEKYSIEMRYQTYRNVLASQFNWDSNFSSLSLILGYTLF